MTGSGSESQASAKDDTTSSTCEKVRIGRLAFMRSAFKKSFEGRPPHTRDNSKTSLHSKKNSVAESGTPPIDLSTHPHSSGTFLGNDGAAGKNGAAEAAKAAIGLKKKGSTGSMDAVAAPSALRVKKTRKRKLSLPDTTRHATAPTTTPAANGTRIPTPNESRRVASGPTLSIPSFASAADTGLRSTSGRSTGRNASGASIATIEVHMPQFGSLGIGAVWEMCLVPIEAARMWLRNHPRVMTLAGSVLERGWDMAHIMMLTATRLWTVVFVYSKTGRLKLRREDTAGTFMIDCCRSAVYMLIFMAIGVAVMRVVKWVLDVMGVLGMVINGVVWVIKRLLGYGLLW